MPSSDPRQPDRPAGPRPAAGPAAEVPGPRLWPVGPAWPEQAGEGADAPSEQTLADQAQGDGRSELAEKELRDPSEADRALRRLHRRERRPHRRARQTWVALPGSPGSYGAALEIAPRGLSLGQSVEVRDGYVTFSGPRSAPLTLPLQAVSKVVVVERMNVGRGSGMVVIFCGPDGRAIRVLQQGRWDTSDLLRLAQAVVPEPMFYPGRHKPRHIEAQHPGTLSFGARNFTRITGAVLTMVLLTPVVVVAGLIWVLTLIF